MNFDMAGFNAWQSYLQAAQWCAALPPRLIVFQLSNNDDDPPIPLDVYAARPWLAVSHLAQILNYEINRPSPATMRNMDTYTATQQMVKVAERARVPLIIIYGGTPKSVGMPDRLRQLGATATVPVVVFKIFAPAILRLRSSRHLNHKGSIQLAIDLVNTIRNLGLKELLQPDDLPP